MKTCQNILKRFKNSRYSSEQNVSRMVVYIALQWKFGSAVIWNHKFSSEVQRCNLWVIPAASSEQLTRSKHYHRILPSQFFHIIIIPKPWALCSEATEMHRTIYQANSGTLTPEGGPAGPVQCCAVVFCSDAIDVAKHRIWQVWQAWWDNFKLASRIPIRINLSYENHSETIFWRLIYK